MEAAIRPLGAEMSSSSCAGNHAPLFWRDSKRIGLRFEMQRKAKEYISRKIDIGKNFLHMTSLAQKQPEELKMGLHEIKKFIEKKRSRENSCT